MASLGSAPNGSGQYNSSAQKPEVTLGQLMDALREAKALRKAVWVTPRDGTSNLVEMSDPEAPDLLAMPVFGVTDNSAEVGPGWIFVAVKGYNVDGHTFLPEAARRGAAAVVVSVSPDEAAAQMSAVEVPNGLAVVQVWDSRLALGILLDRFFGSPSRRMAIVGITGTNGKTTTTFMLESIFRHAGHKTGLLGSVIEKVGRRIRPSHITTPGAVHLHRSMDEMVRQGTTHVAIEVSSHALEMNRVAGVVFTGAGITNISYDHMDFHGSFEEYAATKAKLFDLVSPDGISAYSADDSACAEAAKRSKAHLVSFGFSKGADMRITDVDETPTGLAQLTFELALMRPLPVVTTGGTREVKPLIMRVPLKVPGVHNAANGALAAAIALALDVKPESICKGLAAFSGVARRLQVVHENHFTVIDDYAHNPASFEAVFRAISSRKYAAIHPVVAIRGSRGTEINRQNAKVIAEWCRKLGIPKVIATTSVSHVTAKDAVTPDEEMAFVGELLKSRIAVDLVPELPEAVQNALDSAEEGDLVILLGAQGMDAGAAVVSAWLSKRAYLNEAEPFDDVYFPINSDE